MPFKAVTSAGATAFVGAAAFIAGGTMVYGLLAAVPAQAHFQELIPSTEFVTAAGDRTVTLDLVFTHPMARGPAMEMARPARFGVFSDGKIRDLLPGLQKTSMDGKTAWRANYTVTGPGNYQFFVEPKPYWEPAEGKMIVHYTKVVVDAFGAGEGWDQPIGLPVEIMPLTRPYGIWTGNVFQGRVKRDGNPVPHAEVEVEWRNDGSVEIPADAFETQVIRADTNGVFTYAMPRGGWWGFAALVDGHKKMKNPEGKDVDVELGGLIWVRTHYMK